MPGSARSAWIDPSEGPHARFERRELREDLAKAITQLPDRERHILALYYDEELTLAEIAEVIGVGESRVSQLRTQAIARLRSILGQTVLWKDVRKIDNNRPDFEPIAGRKAEAAEPAQSQPAERASRPADDDQVHLSSGAELVSAATAAATQAPDVRSDVVERAKALLESGELGRDTERLADTLIDRALDQD